MTCRQPATLRSSQLTTGAATGRLRAWAALT